MLISRRAVLGGGAAAGIAAGLLPMPGLSHLAFAAGGADRGLLLIVHIRGGWDGLNFISPASDPDFMAARVAELRVLDDGPTPGVALPNGPDPKIDFRLHPAAKPLAELYQDSHLAFIHAAGLTNATRSHFVAMDMLDRGIADNGAVASTPTGWLTRYLKVTGARGGAAATSVSGSVAGEFAGWPSALAVPSLDGGFGPPGGPQATQVLRRLYGAAPGDIGAGGRDALAAMAEIDGKLPRDAQQKPIAYQPDHDVNYDPAADFGRPLKTVAQLMKMDLGLEVATVDVGGWDTHENQAGRFQDRVGRLANGLAAFWNDTSRYHDRMTVVVLSEFGRRLRSNKSGGTDHGRGGVMAVLGGQVAGGRFYGNWPGLAPDRLDEGVDLAVTTDYRRVLTEVLERHSPDRPPTGVFGSYTYPGPLGIIRRAA
ncbi:MAG TPA: DUF1501 domain-containing protein [Stellaceae bacterium]|nr:DUF1501 domain-containing protein [Stellaceae bacterium]